MRPLFNNKGSAFIQALIAVGVVGTMLYFLSPQVIKHREQVTKTSSIISARLALHSMVDYTLFGIKQRWCFSEGFMSEPCAGSGNATTMQILSHPRSIERLLMKHETIDYLRAMGISNPEKALLDKIEMNIGLGSFSALHPVYKMVGELKNYRVSSVGIRIERDRRAIIPEYGKEVYLKVEVSLLDAAGKVIEVGSSRLLTTSYVGVYPREVGSFALLVPGDLRLDSKSGAGVSLGDVAMLQFNSRRERLRYPGLIFESPVFVNGNVYLPEASTVEADNKDNDTVYTPVTFEDKLILGSGVVQRKDLDGVVREFRPRTAGKNADQFWSDVRQMGGFQKGIEVDGARDLGLDYLSGISAGNGTLDPKFMEYCIENNLSKYDLKRTEKADLRGEQLKSQARSYVYRLGLTSMNRFNPQGVEPAVPKLLTSLGDKLDWAFGKDHGGPVAGYEIKIGNMVVAGDLPDNGTVTLEPTVNLEAIKNAATKNKQNAEADARISQDRISGYEKEISSLTSDILDLNSDLRREKDKRPQDSSKIRELDRALDRKEADLRTARSNLRNEKDKLDSAERKVADANKELDRIQRAENVQPKIHISIGRVRNPDNPKDEGYNRSFRDLTVRFENPEFLYDNKLNYADVELKLNAYDVSFANKKNLRSSDDWNKGQLEGILKFTRRGSAIDSLSQLSHYETDKWGRTTFKGKGSLPSQNPYTDYDRDCQHQDGVAFQGTDWSQSFARNSRHSWSFTNKESDRKNIIFDDQNSYRIPGGGGSSTFRVISLAKDCIVEASANFVTGFYTCERLIIKSRSNPLRIIGTFIVSNGVDISPTAYTAGIRWSTIYHPMATYELRNATVLKAADGRSCESLNRFPIWHPYPAMMDVANMYKCNSISLRAKADPFRWTAVDPDCGLVRPTDTATRCKNRMVRFYVLEVARESGI